jgi:2'-5' RNA ligase
VRLFIAVEIPEGVKGKLAGLQDRMRRLDVDAKWVAPANLHLTLKFIGEAEESMLPLLKSAAKEAAARHERFDLYLAGMGVFSGPRDPRVLWVGMIEGFEPLKRLASSIEDAMENLGFARESKPFKGHLTLARFRSRRNAERLAREIEIHKSSRVGPVPVDEAVLFRSVLDRAGPTYSALGRFPLAPGRNMAGERRRPFTAIAPDARELGSSRGEANG